MTTAGSRWIVTPLPRPTATTRLFCVPYAGAGASAFRPLARELPADVELSAIELPGRETRFKELPATNVDKVVAELVAILYPYHLDRPFAFFGHSLGAIIAFELTRVLAAKYAIQPTRLIVSARLAPQVKDMRPAIHLLPEPAFIEALRALGGTPNEMLDDPEMAPLLKVIRADFALNERYSYLPGPALPVPLVVYGGITDPKVTEADLGQWKEQAAGRFSLRMFAGGHFFIHSERQHVLRAISHELNSPR
jgi:medium-chain acyl-[acyl-carrier-protein] hydrolase